MSGQEPPIQTKSFVFYALHVHFHGGSGLGARDVNVIGVNQLHSNVSFLRLRVKLVAYSYNEFTSPCGVEKYSVYISETVK
jgi:hypothetical protein